jgi:hypothetical protein
MVKRDRLVNLQESRNMEDSEAVVKTKPVSTGRGGSGSPPQQNYIGEVAKR